jgi:hypothetical protein
MKQTLLVALMLSSFNGLAQKIAVSDTIPFKMNGYNNMYVKAIFNNTDTLNLNFDTGTTELVLINSVLKDKIKSAPKLYNTVYNLKIGNTNYQTKVYDAQLTAQETDGRFGWDLFKGKVVELNYDKNIMVVHSELPKSTTKGNKYAKLNLEFFKELPLITSSIEQNGVINKDLFLFDSGYQKTAMLDNDLLQQGKFPVAKMTVIKKVIMRGAQGNEIPVITSNLDILRIDKYKLKNVPVQQITTNKPFRNKNIHILGNDVLKRFNVFIDLKDNIVYLKSNHFYKTEFTDQKKDGV